MYSVIHDIARFTTIINYASSFGLQWNEYRTTQLDSYTGLSISRDRLKRLMGGDLAVLKGKQVLEAGCGAGRFTEILLESGAQVFAVDISAAVEANYENCKKYVNYFICQADIVNLPMQPGQFDIVICVGVIQHTPDPDETMAALCEQVRPGGMLVMDHYTYGYPAALTRRLLRAFLIRMPNAFSLGFTRAMVSCLWPFHRLFWFARKIPVVKQLRTVFLHVSPVVDYHDAYPQLGPRLLKIWAALDTHDTLTDRYKHLRSADEIRSRLEQCGMVDIETDHAGNGIEVRAYKPLLREHS